MSIRALWMTWKTFWFKPESPLPVCVFRIVFTAVLLVYCALLYPDLMNWFGAHAISSPETSRQVLAPLGPPGMNIRALLPQGDVGVITLFCFLVVAAICLGLGFCTRTSAVCVYLALATFQQQNSLLINGGDIFLKMSAFYLIFAPAGHRLSLDSIRNARQRTKLKQALPADPPGWAQRMFRFQIALIYFQAFWSKLDDPTWQDGSAIYYVLREHEFLRFPVAWISNSLWMCQSLTWGTLFIEAAMWSLVWFKETRYIALAGALVLHLGIEYTMNLPTFETLMIASLVLFVPAQDIKTFYTKARALFTYQPASRSASIPLQSPAGSTDDCLSATEPCLQAPKDFAAPPAGLPARTSSHNAHRP